MIRLFSYIQETTLIIIPLESFMPETVSHGYTGIAGSRISFLSVHLPGPVVLTYANSQRRRVLLHAV